MVRHAKHDVLRLIITAESADRAEGVIESQRSTRVFVFRKNGYIRRDKCAQAPQEVDPESHVRVALYVHGLRDPGDQGRSSKADIRLKRLPRIAQEEIDADIGDSEMDAGYNPHLLDVGLAVENIELGTHGAVSGKVPELPAIHDRIFQIEIVKSRSDRYEAAGALNVFQPISKVHPNLPCHIILRLRVVDGGAETRRHQKQRTPDESRGHVPSSVQFQDHPIP